MTGIRLGRIFWIGAAAILVAAALVALGAVLRGDFSENDGRILITLAALLYAGGTGLAGLALADRGPGRALGRAVAIVMPACLGLVLWGVWSFVFDGAGSYDASRAAWSAVLVLLVGLVASTGLLLARERRIVTLAALAGVLAAIASVLSIAGIWAEPENEAFVKAVAVLWILTGLAYFLVPVLQRFAITSDDTRIRTLGYLDGVELVASLGDVEGVRVEAPLPGERLTLRRVT